MSQNLTMKATPIALKICFSLQLEHQTLPELFFFVLTPL